MNCPRWLSFVCLSLVFLPVAQAQIQVTLRLPQVSVLRYEAIPAEVRLQNVSGRTLVFDENDDEPWLTFLITDQDGRVVDAVATVQSEAPVVLRAGESARREVDLLRLYDVRATGTYRVQAMIDADGVRGQSDIQRLIVLTGNEIARQVVGIMGADGKPTRRAYTVLVKRGGPHYRLYVQVTDEQEGMIYGMLPVGTYVPMGDPMLRVDNASHLHLLVRSGARAFQYREITPDATVVKEEAYSDLQSTPELVQSDKGVVSVRGGEKVFPREARSTTAPELPAPEMPPPVKKKWWQFWR